jgi:hypothetical protein
MVQLAEVETIYVLIMFMPYGVYFLLVAWGKHREARDSEQELNT